jgi:hypothetical protein
MMHSAPVTKAIALTTPKDKTTIAKPSKEKKSDLLAWLTLAGSPPESKNLIPDSVTKNTAVIPDRRKIEFITFEKITGTHWRVAIPSLTQFPQGIYLAYQGGGINATGMALWPRRRTCVFESWECETLL